MSMVPIGAAMTGHASGDPFSGSAGWRARYGAEEISQFRAADLIADKWGIGRAEMERYALASHQRAVSAIDADAFAPVVLAWQRETGADLARVNTCGGAIALGHPLGATGARLLTTLVHALERAGGRRGLLTMCEGGGQANVTIIERP